jgi:hypothetical protein
LVGDVQAGKIFLESIEVGLAIIADEIKNRWGIGDHLFTGCHFAIEDPKWICFRPSATVFAEAIPLVLQVVLQGFFEVNPTGNTTQGIELQGKGGQIHFFEKVHGHNDEIGIRFRTGIAEKFGIDLVELAKPSFLRPFMPEHGTDGKELLNGTLLIETMLDVGPYHRGCGLRAQGKTSAFAVGKGIHLFGNDIRFFPNTSTKELGPLQNRWFDLLKAKGVKDSPSSLLKKLPAVDLSRKDIFKTLYGGEFQEIFS